MTSNSKKLNNTKIINHLNNLKISKVAVDNSKQLTLLSNTTESLLKKTKLIKFNDFLNKLLTALVKLISLFSFYLFSFLKGSTSTTGFKQVVQNSDYPFC